MWRIKRKRKNESEKCILVKKGKRILCRMCTILYGKDKNVSGVLPRVSAQFADVWEYKIMYLQVAILYDCTSTLVLGELCGWE